MINKSTRILITGGSGFIGTNLIDALIAYGCVHIINIDYQEPRNVNQLELWSFCDIKNLNQLHHKFQEFQPDMVIHLAARTDIAGLHIDDYQSNTEGVSNTIDAINNTKSVKRAVFASSMLVCSVGYQPNSDSDYNPPNAYGESKVLGEKYVRENVSTATWTIIRPTSIWGPWFDAPYRTFFEYIKTGRYFHIRGSERTLKTYGYVGNVCAQIIGILNADHAKVREKTLYLGDYEYYNITDWANEIALLVGRRIKILPNIICTVLAKIGDFVKVFGIIFPMSTFRHKNMTTSNMLDLKDTKAIVSNLPYNRTSANKYTLKWLNRNQT